MFFFLITIRIDSIYILHQIISATEFKLFVRCFCMDKAKRTKGRMKSPNEVSYSFYI